MRRQQAVDAWEVAITDAVIVTAVVVRFAPTSTTTIRAFVIRVAKALASWIIGCKFNDN
jgi:hypothetical protein